MSSHCLRTTVAVVAATFCGPVLAAALPVFQGEPVEVSATRVPVAVSALPASVTVIDRAAIEASPARTLAELLSLQAGAHVRTGASPHAVVDLRGFGMAASSNTLILVDGVRLTTNDLAAPRLDTVSLPQVERIEILRGSGAVQYGSGTTGGVINIVTRKAAAGVHGNLLAEAGSDDRRRGAARLTVAGPVADIALYADGIRDDHTRRNASETTDLLGMVAGWNYSTGRLALTLEQNSQRLGLPGPRRVNPGTGLDEYGRDPSGSRTPADYADSDTTRSQLHWQQALGEAMLYVDVARRDKDSFAFFGDYDYGGAYNSTDRRSLKEQSVAPRVRLPFTLAGQAQTLVVGGEWLRGEVNNSEAGFEAPRRSRQTQQAMFLEQSGVLGPYATQYTLGVRRQKSEDSIHFSDATPGLSQAHTLSAWQAGLRQNLGGAAVYAKVGRSFRLANADELVATGNRLLAPQTSRDTEVGVEWQDATRYARLALYQSDLKNEIHYSPYDPYACAWGTCNGYNRNLDPTRRRGVELEGRWAVSDSVRLTGQYTYQDATFREGQAGTVPLSGRTVPMVPSHLASLGLSWQATPRSLLAADLQYVGEQFMDNDQGNTLGRKLDDHTVLNLKYRYQMRDITVETGVSNVLDEQYASYGIRSIYGSNYNLYPAERRTWYLRTQYSF
ncbi:TonB-dependent receptor [Gulbenkiania mobilis]|uniref:Iron complex outermembrane receptor protein n=1 Tax=Gulbenkiania mobilis TaxID=397457 RepID=A0ABY2CXU5_GULMO|nr:iron complex outermembrane receptor protein [Gulbenkiania mobilis]